MFCVAEGAAPGDNLVLVRVPSKAPGVTITRLEAASMPPAAQGPGGLITRRCSMGRGEGEVVSLVVGQAAKVS